MSLGQSDGALLRENLQRVDDLSERTATTEESLRGMAAMLERIAPAINEIIRQSGDLSREGSEATVALTGVLARLDNIDGMMTNAEESMAPFRKDVARLAERIDEIARTRGGSASFHARSVTKTSRSALSSSNRITAIVTFHPG